MKTRIVVSTAIALAVMAMYWLGVYLHGVEFERGKEIGINYVASLLISFIASFMTAICPIWDRESYHA